MTWYAWALVIYFIVDRLCIIAMVGRSITIEPSVAVTSVITGSLIIWAILKLAGAA